MTISCISPPQIQPSLLFYFKKNMGLSIRYIIWVIISMIQKLSTHTLRIFLWYLSKLYKYFTIISYSKRPMSFPIATLWHTLCHVNFRGEIIQSGSSFCRILIWNSSNENQRIFWCVLSLFVTFLQVAPILLWNHQFWMSLCSWSSHLTRIMGISSYISRPKIFSIIPLARNKGLFDTKPNII